MHGRCCREAAHFDGALGYKTELQPNRLVMILEIAHLTVRVGQNAAFEQAFAKAQTTIASMPGYLAYELGHCLERPQEYVLLVRWATLEDHEVGFRQSPQYQDWKRLLHHFYDPFPTVLHFGAPASSIALRSTPAI